MSLRNSLLGLVLLLKLAGALAAPPVAEVDRRLQSLSTELRCLVCQNQSLADSDADFAVDLRHQIRAMIETGKSDEEIRVFLVSRFGDFILYDPPVTLLTLMLWLGPFLFLAIGLWLLIRATQKPT